MTTIKGVVFDLGGTLMEPKSGDWFLTPKFYELFPGFNKARYTKEQWDSWTIAAMAHLRFNHELRSQRHEEAVFTEFYQLLMNNFPGYHISMEQAQQLAHDRTYNYDNFVLYPDTISTLQELKKRGIRIGFCSDTYPSIHPANEALGLTGCYDCAVYSYEFGKCKPTPILFKTILKKMDLPADEILFVDDLAVNLEGAEKYGMHGVQSLAKPDVEKDPTYPGIHKPSEILNLL